ncbi:formate dehydrogenase accessory protein FdhE [Methylocella silvestris BL2]|uniref:Protein FdhE homolog n=1 Tax=Methylocella silvestris (strain DSM 15510 / CIP 108128 / LMG 27833 / NCIMB 13906 / BL2) TaxID=395965 RepID=B8ES19_METSB|nr:formate dehydrogenase accessory protein FdhE [Methylocella silvestris]ACK52234.1 formate dehydrogenase accessory protein FdhE [Methylocella silvestris BL2]
MRQGEVAPKGAWIGDPQGGVKAPEPLLLPNPLTRFTRSAARLRHLSDGHPLMEWLRFMAQLSDAQHAAALALGPLAAPDAMAVERAVDARMPPLAADGHRRNPIWREGLAVLLGHLDQPAAPEPALSLMAALRQCDAGAIEAHADDFLHGEIEPQQIGATLYIAAALQVYFTLSAAALPAASLRLLPQRGLCPCCGSTPVAGVITASGTTPGTRYLYCSLCSTAWNHVRAICITCGESRSLSLKGIEGDSGAIKAEVCDACHSYAKMLYSARDMEVDPYADDLATLGLDLLVTEAGWARHAPNPLLLSA